MFKSEIFRMPRQEYTVFGATEGNVNKALEECGKTNREEINAEKETTLMEWEVNLKKAEMESNANLARIEKENQERMKKLDCDLEVKLKEIEHELTADHKFELEQEKIKATKELWQQKLGSDHKERMKLLEIGHAQTMQAMNIRGNFALTALQKSGQKSFRMKNSALTFQPMNTGKMMKKFKPHNMLAMEKGMDAITDESAAPHAIEEHGIMKL